MSANTRWTVIKDYYTENGDNCTDTWCILYGSQKEADEAKARLEAGQDTSWYNPDDDYAQAFLYVDQIEL